jgi:hypothetical protein
MHYGLTSDIYLPTTIPEVIQKAGIVIQSTLHALPIMVRITKPRNVEKK